MGYAIEVFFDKTSEEKLIEYWRLLHQHGYSSYMYENGGHPHIAFAVFDDDIKDINNFKKIIREYYKGIKSFEILFSYLGLFTTDEGVSFIAPKISLQLLEYHKRFYNKICENGYDEWFNDYYKPDVWIPHCTMTIQTNVRNQMKGLDLLRSVFKPFKAQVERVALIEFYPIKYLEVIELDELQ
ncbi:2'-5' RNA ligase [Vallitalea longa]|uniref:2'-5' RNA ligase n=1 Tax=Vallitalea longa TaxID=2936439 RepID=A0A9W5YEL5_9FIRM|nr:2'-5' RNA ligase family protein [Vallitalea longa]GKX30908.1 2'-5' RNA ligase [Vallitalea longa]